MTWTTIFRAGTHTDSQGRSRTWTTDDLDHMIASYDPAKREAPLVLGHPKDNAPAFGWVECLRRVGGELQAAFRQVPDSLKQAIAAGHYKYKSISVFDDGTLRHVGVLGAAQPAVAGLGPIELAADETYTEYLEENRMTVEELQAQLAEERAKREAAEASFAAADTRRKELEADVAEKQRQADRAAREKRFEALASDGRVLPAEKDRILSFAAALGQSAEEVCFTEGGGKKALEEHFWDFLAAQPQHGLLGEFKAPEGGVKHEDYVSLTAHV